MNGMEKMYAEVFLKEQGKLFQEPVAYNVEEAVEFLEENLAQVFDTIGEVREYFDENGMDDIGMSDEEIEDALANCNKQITVAVMGCVVNGPGEAKEADIGVAGGDGCGVIFKRGEVLKKVNEDEIVTELLKEIDRM